jgi:hypothetical protein
MEFREFEKIPRLKRNVVITEKIDGTNAAVVISHEGIISAQSRSKVITPDDDNYGFARWVEDNAEELAKLGEGYHYGEWWGCGIQRRYGMDRKVFSLFNVGRWTPENPNLPACCSVVPILAQGALIDADAALADLKLNGSRAAPGFMKPEGIIVYHSAARMYFKMTIEKDDEWKGKQKSSVPQTGEKQS